MILPNLIIAGVPKAGTSSLHLWLAAHPQTLGSDPKETAFFADRDSHIYNPAFNADAGLEAYARAFSLPDRPLPQVIFESTPAYIYQRRALALIPGLPSRPKVVFVLREPAAQIRSVHDYYRLNWNHIPAGMTLGDFVAAVAAGEARFGGNELAERALEHARYARWLGPWRDALGPDRMRILLFEQVMADPAAAMQDLALWLGIDPGFYDVFDFARENQSYRPRSLRLQRLNIALRGHLPKGRLYDLARRAYRRLNTTPPRRDTDATVIAGLKARFAPDNAALARDFGLDLSLWD